MASEAGLIATHPMDLVAISHVVVAMERRERSIPPAALPRAHVRREEKANLGAKKQRKVRNNEHHKRTTTKHHSRRA